MEHADRDANGSGTPARVAADEAAASAARDRYRLEPMAPIPPDPWVAAMLASGEVVVATRASAVIERRDPRPAAEASAGIAGALYLTSRRLLVGGRVGLSLDLDEIQEAGLAGERLLLLLRDGLGLTVEAALPRLLRVEIATARAALRG